MARRDEDDGVAARTRISSRAGERWRCGAGTMNIAGPGQGRPGGAVPIAISAEQRVLQASIRDWAERAGTLALVRGLEPGSQPEAPGSAAGPPGSPARPADVPGPSVSAADVPGPSVSAAG